MENKKGTSWKSKLQFDIDNAISQATTWNEFLELRKLGINSKKELENYIKDSFVNHQNLLDRMKEIDSKLVHHDKMIEVAHTVNKYKKVYDSYLKDKKNPIFKSDYSKEISEYKKALTLLKNNYSKMPNTEFLCEELKKLQEKKNTLYAEYSTINDINYKTTVIKK